MMGVGVKAMLEGLAEYDVDIIGCNCGTGIDIQDYVKIMSEFTALTDKPLIAQPNAGQPERTPDGVVYHESPEKMASHIAELAGAGARIIGGCCGTTPRHIEIFRAEIDKLNA